MQMIRIQIDPMTMAAGGSCTVQQVEAARREKYFLIFAIGPNTNSNRPLPTSTSH
jgi:hypothetical protein